MYFGLFTNIIFIIGIVLPLLINVAFITLLERKILAGSQSRTGPVKNGFLGLLQPFADVIKLFMSQMPYPTYRLKGLFLITPLSSLILAVMLTGIFSLSCGHPSLEFSIMFIMTILSLNVYPLLLSGWSSNSVYAYLGGIRGVAQTISYEISLAFIMLALFSVYLYLSFSKISTGDYLNLLLWIPLFFLWTISTVAELNRTPFDFSEGESELVSGFNVEYGSVKFAIFFMAEYLMILSFSFLTTFMFLGSFFSNLSNLFFSMSLMMMIIWLRATYPRFRYDMLMLLAWKVILPWSLSVAQLCTVLTLIL